MPGGLIAEQVHWLIFGVTAGGRGVAAGFGAAAEAFAERSGEVEAAVFYVSGVMLPQQPSDSAILADRRIAPS